MSTPIDSLKLIIKGKPDSGHRSNEGIREWFAREDWLLSERDVKGMLALRRSVAARYYNEWGLADPDVE